MSDFLNFVDEIIDGTPKYNVTDNVDGTKSIELANEIVQEGTALNRANLQRLNRILGYTKITGTYNPTTENVEYTYPYFDTNNLVDNMRVLVQGANEPTAPPTNLEIIKNTTSIGTYFNECKTTKLLNGNIFIVGRANNGYGYIAIVDSNGNIIKSSTSIGMYYLEPQVLTLSNGNVIIVGNYNGSRYNGYFTIYSQDGTQIKSSTAIAEYMNHLKVIEKSDGNVFIVGEFNGYVKSIIIDKQGNTIKSVIETTNAVYSYPSIIELSNKNIMLVGGNGTAYFVLYDSNGNIIKQYVGFGTNRPYIKITELSNGNILICSQDNSDNGIFTIIDNEINIIKNQTNLGSYYSNLNFLKMSNNNILIYGNGSNGSSYISIIDENGNIVLESKNIASVGMFNLYAKELSGGNILITSQTGGSLYYTTIDIHGNVITLMSLLDNATFFQEPKFEELNDNNILIFGHGNATSYDGNFLIAKPYSTSFNVSINGVEVDTAIIKDKYYELVYNETLAKFIAKEVRQ